MRAMTTTAGNVRILDSRNPVPDPRFRNRRRKTFAAGLWNSKLLRIAFCVLPFALLSLAPLVLNAQGCAMCYTSAEAARAGAQEALAHGVIILLAPPMVFFALFAVVVYRYRDKYQGQGTKL